MNELTWLIVLVISFIGILVFHNYFGKTGLYIWSSLAIIIANIQAVMLVKLFGLETALGSVIYITSFLVANIILEKYGTREAKKAILMGVASMVAVSLLMNLCLLYIPSSNDVAYHGLKLVFSINTRVTIASLIAYLTSQFCNMMIYQHLKNKYHKIWLSNGVSTIITQLIDTIIFLAIAFTGVFSFKIILELVIARYIFKLVAMIIGTPLIYIAKDLKTE